MDYVGQIEENYKCSGICDKEDVYFFSDATVAPEKGCVEYISVGIKGSIQLYCLGYLAISAALMVGWCVHVGLCRPFIKIRKFKY